MTSTSAQPPSTSIAPAAGAAASPLAGLMQSLAASPEEGARGAARNFDSLLAPGAPRSPRAATASGAEQAALPAQALNNAAANSKVGLWAAMQPPAESAEAAAAPSVIAGEIEPVGSAEPLRSELETAAAILITLVQAMPAAGAKPTNDASVVQNFGEETITVELSGEPAFTVAVPRTKNPVAAGALAAAAEKTAERSAATAQIATSQTPGARAAVTPADLSADGTPKLRPDADTQGGAPASSAMEAEVALQDGRTIRFAIKPVDGAEPGPKTRLATPGAEIAPARQTASATPIPTGDGLKKTFLSVVDKQLAESVKNTGISAAKSGGNMPDQASATLPAMIGSARTPELAAGLLAGSGEAQIGLASGTPEAEATGARRAVDTAINLMEIQAGHRGRDQSTVSVRMKLAGEDLAIRVEMRDGEVHTSFNTSSHDLRAALSKEWQAVAAESPHRILRFHEPEFSNIDRNLADRGASEYPGRDNHSAREQAQARREAGAGHGFNGRPAAAPSILPAAIAGIMAPGSLHLSTFA